jgi:exosortase/archaeosortase family protein
MNFLEKQIYNKLLKKFKKKKLTPRERRLFSTLVFLIRLLLLSIPLYIILASGLTLTPIQKTVSVQTENILTVLGYDVSRDNIIIKINKPVGDSFLFTVSEDCTGWKSMLFLFALIFAIPGVALVKRFLGLFFGLPIIWIGNLLRILIVVFVEGTFGYSAAMIIHDYLWQAGLIALVLSLWVIWIRIFRIL